MSQRPLYSEEAEQSVLGALLLSNAAYERIDGQLTDADFFFEDHRRIFAAIVRLISDGKPADVVTVSGALGDGWIEKLGPILEAVPTAAHITQYATVVRERRIERDLNAASEAMMLLAHAGGPVHDRLDEAQRLITALTETSATREATMIGDVLFEVVESIEQAHARDGALAGHPTGVTALDKRIGGLQPGLLYIIGGRPSMGKTALALQAAEEAARASGKTALVFSMEMSKQQLTKRALSRAGRIAGDALRDGKMQGDEWERLSMGLGKLKELKLLIDDTPALTPDQVRSRARRAHRRGELSVIVIDYLQLMAGRGDSREQELSYISRSLKTLAKELNVPVIALSQLSRKCEERTNKRPIMSDIRESGAIEQDADVIVFVYRDEYYNPNSEQKGIAELNVAKQRDGATGTVFSTFVAEYSHFADTEFVPREPEISRPQRRGSVMEGFDG